MFFVLIDYKTTKQPSGCFYHLNRNKFAINLTADSIFYFYFLSIYQEEITRPPQP